MIDLKNSSIQAPIVVNTDSKYSEESENRVASPEKLFLENLETELINKIRKTPYWETGMIENYFDNKLKRSNGLRFSQLKKDNFIETVLILSNNR